MTHWFDRVRLSVACAIAGPLFWGEYVGGDMVAYQRGYLDGVEHATRRTRIRP